MTIIEIFVLCHVHVINEPYHHPSPAVNRAYAKFMNHGLIVPDRGSNSGFRTTQAGETLVERLKAVNQ